MRSRLLQRIHLAYLRHVQAAKSSSNTSEDVGTTQLLLLREEGGEGAVQENCDSILTATSLRMTLAMLQCLGPTSECQLCW